MAFTNQKTIFKTLIDEKVLDINGRALDLGCGKGDDVLTFSEKGFEVDAVDKNKDSLNKIRGKENIHVFNCRIEDFVISENTYNLITASFVLQFLSKEKARDVVRSMVKGLKTDGITVFNLIGNKDAWANNGKWSTWKHEEIIEFLKILPVEIRNFNEKQGIGDTISEGLKFWHVFEIVLIKKR